MKKISKNQEVGQFGEYAVASELCRRGFVATTFTRNVEGFDILGYNKKNNKFFKVQVKTCYIGDWFLDAKKILKFDEAKFEAGFQKIIGENEEYKKFYDFIVFVKENEDRAKDKFYILSNENCLEVVKKHYSKFLERKNGIRPKNPKSTNVCLKLADIKNYEDNWDILD